MPSLIISRDSHFYKIFPLEGKTTIGRGHGNDVVLNAAGVSRNHACIDPTDGGFDLLDAGSTNGTFIDDQRVHRHPLAHGTSFRIHDYLFTFVKDVLSKDSPSGAMATLAEKDAASQKMVKTLWMTQQVGRKHGLGQKLARLLQMVTDVLAASADADIGALVLDAVFEITGAKRGIIAMQQETGGPTFTHIRGFGPHGERPMVSRAIFKKVLSKGICVHHRCAAKEEATQSMVQLDLKSVLCVPLTAGDQTIGCLYLDHPDHDGVFSETDRDLLAASAVYMAEAFLAEKEPSDGLGRDEERFARELEAEGIIARSPKTLKVFQDTRSIAHYNVAVLIFGETGTGKEVIARYIHTNSGRNGQFIACNCSAIAASMFESELFGHEKGAFTGAAQQRPGILELADQGTIFLDEIGDMPVELQSKLLRALQEQEVWRVGGRAAVKIDVHIISATHKDIKNKRRQLQFRDDLYYRLANVEITAPSLRDRPEDIAPLCQLILESLSAQHLDGQKALSISPKAVRLLEAYDWPGNIRELRNMLIQIALRSEGGTIEPRHLKGMLDVFSVSPETPGGQLSPLAEVERVHIIRAMKHTQWNKSAAAKVLQIDRNRLSRRLKKLGIEEPG